MRIPRVVLFAAPGCVRCAAARAFLERRGVPFTEFDVTADPTALRELVRLTGVGAVPAVGVDDDLFVGFDEPEVEAMLAEGEARTEEDLIRHDPFDADDEASRRSLRIADHPDGETLEDELDG